MGCWDAGRPVWPAGGVDRPDTAWFYARSGADAGDPRLGRGGDQRGRPRLALQNHAGLAVAGRLRHALALALAVFPAALGQQSLHPPVGNDAGGVRGLPPDEAGMAAAAGRAVRWTSPAGPFHGDPVGGGNRRPSGGLRIPIDLAIQMEHRGDHRRGAGRSLLAILALPPAPLRAHGARRNVAVVGMVLSAARHTISARRDWKIFSATAGKAASGEFCGRRNGLRCWHIRRRGLG